MAIVKILFNNDAGRMEKYLKDHERKENPQTEFMVGLDSLKKEFVADQKKARSEGNELIHIIQSFSPEESKRLTPEHVHAMGVELVSRFAPGHQYVVQTHTDQAHLHNHIALNPVNAATGERIQNKKRHLQTVREISNEISLENGLSVLPGGVNKKRSGLSDKVQRIERARGRSYIVDLAGKANFARHHATGYDDYVAILNAFDIQVRIEPKNITYFYPGREHGARGKSLDPQLDKPSLERKFESNRVTLLATPERKASLAELVANYRTPPRALSGAETQQPAPALLSARADGVTQPRSEQLAQSIIPIEEIQRAKTQSILAYCSRTKIGLTHTDDGRTVLKGRDYVEVSELHWINHRNKTRGNAIDFVASHRDVGFLQAVSILNDNPKLLLLERHLGEAKKSYQPFYVPKGEATPRAEAISHLALWLGHPTGHRVHGELLKQQRLHVSRGGVIRLFGSDGDEGAMEYVPQEGGGYHGRRRGSPNSAFFSSQPKKAKELHLYLDPETFLKTRPNLYTTPASSQAALLVLLAPALKPVHQTAARLKELESVIVVGGDAVRARDRDILTFFDSLKDSLDPFHIDTRLTWEPPALAAASRGLDRDRGLEREIQFP